MELATWTYEGPPHVGAIRIAASMRDVHLVLHAPQGDTYADLLFTMIERRKTRPPVTYTTFQARDLSGDTAEIFKDACREAAERFKPSVMLVGASCTAELIQDDPGGLAKTLDLTMPVVPLELPSYQKKENWGAAETFYRLVRACASSRIGAAPVRSEKHQPVCNILGPASLGFRNRDDIGEVRKLLEELGIAINAVAPLGASPEDLARLPEADFNVVLYPEIAAPAARWLKKTFAQESVTLPPIGVGATLDFIKAVAKCAGISDGAGRVAERLSWYARSIDSNYLTGKRVFIFGDATHAVAAARICHEELGFKVCGLGTYTRELARDVRAAAERYGVTALVTDNHLDVEDAIIAAQPELVLGTQMERHIAKRLRVPCAVISSPVHVQDFPARYSPQMGPEGANVIFDSWVHPLMMGLEEHLLQMFRDDFEFNDTASASHLAAVAPDEPQPVPHEQPDQVPAGTDKFANIINWTESAEKELRKIPFFVRGKARRNTESFAAERGVNPITIETLYDAKAHFGR
ncbi:ferredoxin:protochlorophyllide reductase (ATP-dependent) subunit B [Roseibium sp. RKSG952]|uniref:ferredoxin:protochlorophyllide reductase (ATP-dependent) subunit B n=1 Tax=Roseibium sp. RKSG952 TaxID=2529384 RepID=UPI0012BD2159|nr:ferredoxin:protochlorophyllide reductase (ATP-dependent) subunit B [Roseibium sp. RKSG952]MTH98798.1 ferredoxin:protochlorophyllide reductase (ATP-dependent) subunit B [Roseibium sp. RKSG952]